MRRFEDIPADRRMADGSVLIAGMIWDGFDRRVVTVTCRSQADLESALRMFGHAEGQSE